MPQNKGKSTTEHLQAVEEKVDSLLEKAIEGAEWTEKTLRAFQSLKHTAIWLAVGAIVAVYVIVKVL